VIEEEFEENQSAVEMSLEMTVKGAGLVENWIVTGFVLSSLEGVVLEGVVLEVVVFEVVVFE